MLALAQTPDPPVSPDRTRDRGEGVATSQFGSYVRHGEWIVYPYFEYYRDQDFEYAPVEFGGVGEVDFRARYRAKEGLFFVAYGLTPNLAVEFEAAVIRATFEKSPLDFSAVPARIEESGVGDVEGQLRWRWQRETDTRPELFSYFEAVLPHHAEKPLIGTPGWELKFGTGVVRGFAWGTLTVRGAVEYSEDSSSHFDLGEYAVEYLRRFSRTWRLYLAVEGTQDEVELIGELQWHVSPNVFVKFNSGVGLTSKATDWAPEIGIVFAFPRRRTVR